MAAAPRAHSAAAPLRCLLALAALFATSVRAYSGVGTAYGGAGGRGIGACGIRSNLGRWETYYVSINERQYQRNHCGRCIRVKGARGSVVAMIVDQCIGCGHGDVDLSSPALQAATGYSWDRKPVNWDFVSCGSSGSSKGRKQCPKGKRGAKCRRQRTLL